MVLLQYLSKFPNVLSQGLVYISFSSLPHFVVISVIWKCLKTDLILSEVHGKTH